MTRRGPRIAPALGLLLCLAAPADSDSGPAVRVTLDNDQFNFWQVPIRRPDFGYTHGTEIALRLPRAPHAVARLAPGWLLGDETAGGEPALELRVRQNIYSPWTLPPDRHYAGWLEAAVGVSRSGEHSYRELLAHVGITGPPSLAGTIQRGMHQRYYDGDPPDWSGQLLAEPGFGLEAGAVSRGLAAGNPAGLRLLAGGSGRARLGTYAVDLRLGLPMVVGWAPPGLWTAGAPVPAGWSIYVRLNPHVEFIARDEFLDGTLFRHDPGPGARPVVAESEAAVGVARGHLGIEWRVLRRSREFDGQPRPHTYSSLAATWSP